jgi:acetyl-CoA C-acetyltransferase
MSAPAALIAAWARSAVAPVGGAFCRLQAHQIGAPVLQALLQRAQLSPQAVDAVVLGNALGAGGNPARMLALAAGLPERCAALSVDSQCCSGLDAIATAVGLLASGQASVVIAGGVEAWSRAPLRHTRPLHAGEVPVPYARPAFAPDPARDPDLLESAADYAAQQGITRLQQDTYALDSHQRAWQNQDFLRAEIVAIHDLQIDAYPRALTLQRAARMPLVLPRLGATDCSLSALAISTQADGAALVLLATPQACLRLGLTAHAAWLASASIGADPCTPLLAAQTAAQAALQRAGMQRAADLQAIELHDAFAAQGLGFCQALGLQPSAINRRGGGLARGHPIGASGAIALVRLLADLQHDASPGARGLAAVAGAGGVGAAVLLARL